MTAREVLAEIEQRSNAATPGPWEPTLDSPAAYPFVWAPEEGQEYTDPGAVFVAQTYRDDGNAMADPEFIAHARTDVPKLVAALRAVLDEHHPDRADGGQTCSRCGDWSDGYDVGGMFVAIEMTYPCPTVRAITEALDGTR